MIDQDATQNANTGGPGRDFGIRVAGPALTEGFRGLPAGQTILNAIGNLLAYGCQLE
jgi:hypothetical protein